MVTFTSKEDEDFFAAIGRLTISWAHIEAGLDMSIAVIHPNLGGSRIEPDAPRTALSRKLRYIRKWAKTVPEPTFRESASALVDEIEKAAELRHDLIHGFIIEHAEGSGEVEMIRMLRTTAKPCDPKRYKVTTVQILKAAVQADKLAGRSLRMGTGLQDLLEELAKKED
jgi:hypothetical protein